MAINNHAVTQKTIPCTLSRLSHSLLARLLSFMTDIVDGIKVVGVHTHRTGPHIIEKAPNEPKECEISFLKRE
jgi:hypothetical protein